jgi:uncharacterized membrane protein
MQGLLFVLTFIAALGAGLVAGIFFGFSAFIMTALGRIPSPKGISAIQSIIVAVLNPVFFSAFFGTGVICLSLPVVALVNWSGPAALYLLAGALLYLVGFLLVTIVFNVPLNEKLKAVSPDSTQGAGTWSEYLSTWTAWNTVRTVASLAASASFILAIYVS